MNLALANLWKHPKTTITAGLSLAIAIIVAVMDLPPGAKWSVIVLAVLKACLGFASKDTGREEAQIGGKTAMVDSTEVPDVGRAVK